MANDKFSAEDLFDSSGFKQITNDFDKVIGKLDEFINSVKVTADVLKNELGQSMAIVSKLNLNAAKGVNEYVKAEQENIKLLDRINKLLIQQQKLEQEKVKVEKTQTDILIKLAKEKERQQKIDEKNLATQAKIVAKEREKQREYNKLQAALSSLNKRIADLLVKQAMGVELTRKETIVLQRLQEKQKLYDKTLKDVDASLGRHQRNVGNYTQSIKDAINQTGVFGGVLGELRNGLEVVRQGFEKADTTSKKFGAALKGLGILAVISAISAITAAIESFQNAADETERFTQKAKNVAAAATTSEVSLERLNDATDRYIELNRQARQSALETAAALKILGFVTKDLSDDVNDGTLAISARIEAEQELLKAQKEVAKQTNENAKAQALATLAVINQTALRLGAQQSFNLAYFDEAKNFDELRKYFKDEEIKGFAEIVSEYQKTTMELNDIEEDQTKFRRKQLEIQLGLDLSYINNKKLRALDEAKIIQDQIEDDQRSVEEKEKANNELIKLDKQRFRDTIKILNDERSERIANTEATKLGTGSQEALNLSFLSTINSAQKLNEYLNRLNITELERSSIINAVKKNQDDLNKTEGNSIKIAQEKLDIQKRISELQATTAQRVRDAEIQAIEEQQQAVEEFGKKYEEQILERGLFNKKQMDFRKALFEESQKLIDAEAKAREEDLKKQREKAIKDAEDSIVDKQEEAAKIADINKEFDQKEIDAKKDTNDKKKKLDEEYYDFRLALEEAQVKEVASLADRALTFIQQNQEKKFDTLNNNISEAIDRNESKLEDQRERAAQGLQNELAFREAQADKLKAIEQREAERQEKMQEVLAYIKLFTGYAAENPSTALANTLRDMALMTAGKVLYASEGNEFVDADQATISAARPFAKGEDKIPAMLRKGERVITPERNIKYWDALQSVNDGTFNQKYLPAYSVPQPNIIQTDSLHGATLTGILKANTDTVKRLESLERTIYDKPVANVELTKLGDVIQTTIAKGLVTKTLHKKPRFKT